MFEPFPAAILCDISEPGRAGPGWGYGLLPFLHWLKGHLGWRSVAVVEDGRGLSPPVLQQAVKGERGVAFTRLDAARFSTWTPGRQDFVHVTAECSSGELRRIVAVLDAQVVDGGLILLQQPSAGVLGHDGALRLPIADGVALLQPHGPPNPVMAWLHSRGAAEIRAFGRLFDSLGADAGSRLDLDDLRVRADQMAAQDASEAALRQRLRELQDNDGHLRALLEQAAKEHDAVRLSTSWRVTQPLRWASRIAGRARGAAHPVLASEAPQSGWEPLAEFLAGSGRLVLPAASQPALTVLLIVEDQAVPLFACLMAVIAAGLGGEADVLIVANGSGGDTALLLDRVDRGRILALESLRPAAEASTAGMRAGAGEFTLLLDCRVRLRPGAVPAALATMRATPWAAVVCGKVFNLSGAIVQAGEVVDTNGRLHGRGAGLPILAPEVQYRCPVPSGTAMFLLVRTRLLRQSGGLSPAFAGTGHAGADLCLRLREAGWHAVYEPLAEVQVDAAAGPQAEAALFAIRHGQPARSSLAGSPAGPGLRGQRRLLMIDDRVPFPALGAGYPRAARLIHELHRLGWQITYFPIDRPFDEWGGIYRQFPREVEFMLGYGRAGLGHLLHVRNGVYDTVVVSRPHNMRDYLAARHATARPRRLAYDAEAVFAAREFLRLQQAGRLLDPAQRQAMLDEEIGLTASADIVTAVNAAEADMFLAAGCRNVEVLGLGTELAPIGNGLAQRRDFLFVGALGEDNSPNADAVAWFVQEVMPLLDHRIGSGYRLLVAGRCRAPKILALAGERVQILGMVDDLTPLYATARAFVAPTRYAAGLPLKVQESVGRGLPVVGTDLLAAQLGWTAERDMLAASTADGFAACCARLYTDPALWYALRRQGLETLAHEARQDDFAAKVEAIFGQGWLETPG